ncbi:hypothetical protein C8R46DRAFT_923496 [Mycena filopes]|nr:hypothetical protein C8R46DRAFT_923496 [Mycena filopes]
MDAVTHTPVEGLWFNDGTLVLQAGAAAFRVYAGLLAERSPVFHDMLQFPQPEGGSLIEGCPVVELSDDKRDLECFPRALFDHEFFLPYPAKTDFNTISGIIRLSTKYQVDTLRKRGLVHLSSAFPTDISQYPMLYDNTSWKLENGHGWVGVVLFGQELSFDWILPLAYYRVAAALPPTQVMNGMKGERGVVELSAADKLLCLEQSIALRTLATSAILSFLWEPTVLAECENLDESECVRSRLEACKYAERRRFQHFPLRMWETEQWEALLAVCESCLASMKSKHAAALQDLWDGLPQRFGLVDWAALAQIKAAALV